MSPLNHQFIIQDLENKKEKIQQAIDVLKSIYSGGEVEIPAVVKSTYKKRGPKPKASPFNGGFVKNKGGRPKKAIMKEYGLTDKEMKIMRTYLAGWCDQGHMTEEQEAAIAATLGVLKDLTDIQREQIREIFYDVRKKVYGEEES